MSMSMEVIKRQQIPIEKVIEHPLVLLSVVDHFTRVDDRRVIGVLLGTSYQDGTIVDVTNSYAVPFVEDDEESLWFLHKNHESMFSMFEEINEEHVVGWYSTGPELRAKDLEIHALFHIYVRNPILVVIDVLRNELELPTKAYCVVEEVNWEREKVFVHVLSEIAADEVEEIVVEHMLRDVKDTTITTLEIEIAEKLVALKGLYAGLTTVRVYLEAVILEQLPINHDILYHLQDAYNLFPNLKVPELTKGFIVKTNDMMLVIYLSSLIWSVIALHNLINNKIINMELEKAEGIQKQQQADPLLEVEYHLRT